MTPADAFRVDAALALKGAGVRKGDFAVAIGEKPGAGWRHEWPPVAWPVLVPVTPAAAAALDAVRDLHADADLDTPGVDEVVASLLGIAGILELDPLPRFSAEQVAAMGFGLSGMGLAA